MSERGGIVYELDDNAKLAVKKITDKGYLPYHVVVSNTEFGTLYDVLYVSDCTDNWPYERVDKIGIIQNYCYNATNKMMSEYGSSQYISSNGGLTRIA